MVEGKSMVPGGNLIFLIELSEAVSLCTDATQKPASNPMCYGWYFMSPCTLLTWSEVTSNQRGTGNNAKHLNSVKIIDWSPLERAARLFTLS